MRRRGWAERLLHGGETIGLLLLRSLLHVLPLTARIRLGGWLGGIAVSCLPPARARVDRNTARVFPGITGAGQARIRRAVGDNFGRLAIEFDALDRLARDRARFDLSGPGLEVLRTAQAEGRGAVIVSAHFGNWEAIRIALQQAGLPCGMIYRAFNNAWFDGRIRRNMMATGQPVVVKGREGMRAFLLHVREGGAGLILVDQKQTGAPLLPFLGRPAETVLVAADLATRYRVPLLPAFATRAADGLRFSVEIEAPVMEGTAAARMTAVNERIARRIVACPGQWFWLHNRWRG